VKRIERARERERACVCVAVVYRVANLQQNWRMAYRLKEKAFKTQKRRF